MRHVVGEEPRTGRPPAPRRGDSRRAVVEWRKTRAYLNTHRAELARRAGELYPARWRVAGTPLLAAPHWVPAAPVALDEVWLSWASTVAPPVVTGAEPQARTALPTRGDSREPLYPRYSDAVAAIDHPALFHNRACYRLLDVDVAPGAMALAWDMGRYLDTIDVCEAVAHEYAAAVANGRNASLGQLPFRRFVGDPLDLRRRSVLPGITTFTLRHDRATGTAEFLLHWRDPSKVASGGGLYHGTPVGVFQPSADAPFNRDNDFDPWRSLVREYGEELLGADEDYGSTTAPIDYESWPLYRAMSAARRDGTLRVHLLGLGVDALTLVTDLLTVAVFDASTFDELFGGLAGENEEGRLLVAGGATVGYPFDEPTVDRFTTAEPMQPSGAATLRLAWRHRVTLLAG